MQPRMLIALLCAILLSGLALAQDAVVSTDAADKSEALATEKSLALIQAALPSLAKVQIWLQVDKGEEPPFSGTISEKRPFEAAGVILSADKVLTQDMAFHPRFVNRMTVTLGEQTVTARPWAYLVEQDAMILQLDQPLKDAKPLDFKADADPPYTAVPYYRANGQWTVTTESIPGDVARNEKGEAFLGVKNYALVLDAEGRPVGTSYGKRLPADGSWRGSPLQKPMVMADDYEKKLAALAQASDSTLLRVTLNFRSPKKGASSAMRYGGEEMVTEQNMVGAVIDPRTVLVWANLKPKTTARLEKIVVHFGDQPVAAQFKSTLKDWGCFLATLDKDAPAVMTLSDTPVIDCYKMLLLTADVRIQGEKRVVYYNHGRISSFEVSYDNEVYPSSGYDDQVLFDAQGRLQVFPIQRRTSGTENRWGRNSTVAMPVALFKGVLDRLADSIDPSNVPVSEEEENRLAWMGVVLQPLNRELARINKVSDETQDGRTGAIVSFVYPDSPAGKAGVEPGWILLRVQVEGEPKPLDVEIEEGYTGSFPWDRLDQFRVEAFEQAPTPWTSIENAFTRALTDFGFGKKYDATFFVDGKTISKDFTITQSPTHYDSAPKFKSDELGLTVRDMTVEVRNYFLKKPEDSGIIISKIEPGSVTAVKGIKPFEIITKVGDTPIHSTKEFEAAIKGQKEFRLEIFRMKTGRTVPIKLDGLPGEKAEAGAKDGQADGAAKEGAEAAPANDDEE